jgi:diguanylate cyclase (GGDEF)-like protein
MRSETRLPGTYLPPLDPAPRSNTQPPGVPSRLKRALAGRGSRIVAAILSLLLLAGTGIVIRAEQIKSRNEIITRFDLRADIGARFLESYVTELATQTASVATQRLAGHSPSEETFTDMTSTLGFNAAVLTDATGHVLRVIPDSPSLIGTDLSAQYPPLHQAIATGRVTLTGVVPAGPMLGPVVGLLIPFTSTQGIRIYNGALSVSTASAGSGYLRTLSTIKGATVWLIDSTGQTIASSSSLTQTADLMKREDPALVAAIGTSPEGTYQHGSAGSSRFAAVAVAGTPWRLVVAAPESQVFHAIGGFSAVVPWLVFAGLVLAAGAVALLQIKLTKARARQLDHAGLLSLTDPMTGLYNRRGYEVLATQLLKDAAREGRSAMLMFLDINGLKTINDTLGHAVGDDAIVAAARLLRSTFRDADVIARLGGDEFCALGVLPGPPKDGSPQLDRLHDAVAFYNTREGAPFHLSLSGGLAIWSPDAPKTLEALEAEADQRMYADKQAERLKAV